MNFFVLTHYKTKHCGVDKLSALILSTLLNTHYDLNAEAANVELFMKHEKEEHENYISTHIDRLIR